MNVAELKAIIADMADDAPVEVHAKQDEEIRWHVAEAQDVEAEETCMGKLIIYAFTKYEE